MIIKLEDEFLCVQCDSKGAEIISIKDKKDNLEYLWTAQEKYWARHAPILFPIVGKVKNNMYKIDEKYFNLGQHGFARDNEFKVLEKSDSKVTFKLSYSEETLKVYPYRFNLFVSYILDASEIKVVYKVENLDDKNIYFSIGAHPGFNCPLLKGEIMEDYYFEFEKEENASIILLEESGHLSHNTQEYLKNSNVIYLSEDIFKNDALIFHSLKSKKVSLRNNKNNKIISMKFEGFPYLGLWSKPTGAPFVCIEPWFGHADYEDFHGDFKDKEGVVNLEKEGMFACEYSIIVEERC